MQPGREPSIATELPQAAEGPNVGVLHDVIGVVLVTGETQGQTMDLVIGRFDEFIKGGSVALLRLRDQLFELVLHNTDSIRSAASGTCRPLYNAKYLCC